MFKEQQQEPQKEITTRTKTTKPTGIYLIDS